MNWLKAELKGWSASEGKTADAWRGRAPGGIAKMSDAVISDDLMTNIVRDYFGRQKRLGDFLGVGESTVAGWVKARSYPDYAKRATLAAFLAGVNARDLDRECELATLPRVVRDGDRWMVVRLERDAAGTITGEIVARDIPDERDARQMVAGLAFARYWPSAREQLEVLHDSLGPDSEGGQGAIDSVLAQLGLAAGLAATGGEDAA